jgi:predicted ester cyclase
MANSNLEAVRKVYEKGWNENELSVLDECLDPNYVDHEAPPGLNKGVEQTKQLFTMYRQIFEGVRFDVVEYIEAPNYITARVVISGKHVGEFLGQKPSGKHTEMVAIDIFHVENGKLLEHWGAMAMPSLAQFYQ